MYVLLRRVVRFTRGRQLARQPHLVPLAAVVLRELRRGREGFATQGAVRNPRRRFRPRERAYRSSIDSPAALSPSTASVHRRLLLASSPTTAPAVGCYVGCGSHGSEVCLSLAVFLQLHPRREFFVADVASELGALFAALLQQRQDGGFRCSCVRCPIFRGWLGRPGGAGGGSRVSVVASRVSRAKSSGAWRPTRPYRPGRSRSGEAVVDAARARATAAAARRRPARRSIAVMP